MRQLLSVDIKVLNKYRINTGMATALLAVAMPVLFSACGGKSKALGDAVTNRDSTAIMTTGGISSLISENGQIKYKITAEEWCVFDQAKPPYQAFEKGAYLEVYDTAMAVTSSVIADTAYYYEDTKTWELRGNVHADNIDNEQFDTPLLFWDQRKELVYSDSTILIRQEKQIIKGIGFESNQDFTRYTIRKTEGVFPIEE